MFAFEVSPKGAVKLSQHPMTTVKRYKNSFLGNIINLARRGFQISIAKQTVKKFRLPK